MIMTRVALKRFVGLIPPMVTLLDEMGRIKTVLAVSFTPFKGNVLKPIRAGLARLRELGVAE